MKLRHYILTFIAIMGALLFLQAVLGQPTNDTVIQDNSTAVYQTLKIQSDLCIRSLNNCKHDVYVNGVFAGFYYEGDLVQVPDNSNVTILLDDPINTNLENSYDTGSSYLRIALMYIIGPIIILVVLYLLIKRLAREGWWRGKRRW